jgi:hypothetical protein
VNPLSHVLITRTLRVGTFMGSGRASVEIKRVEPVKVSGITNAANDSVLESTEIVWLSHISLLVSGQEFLSLSLSLSRERACMTGEEQ